jgi:transposase
VPASDQSGDRDPQKHISKEGDEMLRKLLVGSAHYILVHDQATFSVTDRCS